jgi:EmrB/QacA subfamily drug resistance transporter
MPNPTRAGWETLTAVSLAAFMLIIDVTAVNVALPAVQSTIDADFAELKWVIDSYALALGSTVLIFGSLGDRAGRRFVFVLGLTAFSVASAACALAPDPTSLIAFRVVQGLGGAAMLSTSLALLAVAYSGEQRNRALAMYGASSAAAVAVGPLIGGTLVISLGWAAIFLFNLPISALIAFLVWRGVAESRFPKATGPIDLPGLATLGGSLVLLVLALFRGNDVGWRSGQIVGMIAGSLLLGASFLAIESRARRPLLDLSLFRHPATICASVAMFAAATSVFGMLTYIVFFIQNSLGYDGFETGLRLLPMTAGAFGASMLASRLLGRVPSGVIAGLGLLLAGFGAVIASIQVEAGSDWTSFLVGGVLLGMCHGLVVPSVAHAALSGAPAHHSGMASGLNNSFRVVGMAIGVAAFGAIIDREIRTSLEASLGRVPPGLADIAASGKTDAALAIASDAQAGTPTRISAAAHEAFIGGFETILLVGAGVAFAGAIAAFALTRYGIPRRARLSADPSPKRAPIDLGDSAAQRPDTTPGPALGSGVVSVPRSPTITAPAGDPRNGSHGANASGDLDSIGIAHIHAERDPMATRGRVMVWQDPLSTLGRALHMSGLEYLQGVVAGILPPAPICVTMRLAPRSAEFGDIVIDGMPGEEHFNLIGSVSGGYAATLLDCVMATAILSTLKPGDGFATLTLEVKLVRAITSGTGTVRAHGKVVHRGHRQASAEGTIVCASSGKLLATGTSTCMVTESVESTVADKTHRAPAQPSPR